MNSAAELRSMRSLTVDELHALGGAGDVEVFEVTVARAVYLKNESDILSYRCRANGRNVRSTVRYLDDDTVVFLFTDYPTAFEFKIMCG